LVAGSSAGTEVKVISMQTLFGQAGISGDIDLLKLDIEGGEEALASGSLDWLHPIRTLIAEVHPAICKTDSVIERFESTGMTFVAGGSRQQGGPLMDVFLRDPK
jgi:hypothetical protein